MGFKNRFQTHQQRIKAILLFALAVPLLTLGFYRNQWHAAGKKWFYGWQKERDFWVVGRLVWSLQKGVFSDGALLGIGDGNWPPSMDVISYQFEIYESKGGFDTFWTYTSAIGFQGVLYSFFDQVTEFDPAYNLKIFRGSTALLTAAVLAGLVVWFFLEIGILAALLALAFMMISEWLALFSGSIYWQLWTFYLPLVGVAYYLHQKGKDGTPKPPGLLVFGTVVLKGLFSGFEFVSTALVAIFVPIVYYAVLYRWNLYSLFRTSFVVAASALAGVLVNLGILFVQIAAVKGGWGEAKNTILYALEKRTFYDLQPSVAELANQNVKITTVLWKYINGGRAINFGDIFNLSTPLLSNFSEMRYLHIFVIFLCMSLLFVVLYNRAFSSPEKHRVLALLAATWFSVLAPLSWLAIFKLHSNIHTQLNYIVWQIPFTLYGFALCGAILQSMTIKGSTSSRETIDGNG
ncbi:MAG: hypothetical protein ACOYYJ_19765 [Chloroflexota bacterium]